MTDETNFPKPDDEMDDEFDSELDEEFDEEFFDDEDFDDEDGEYETDPVQAIQDTMEMLLSAADVEAVYSEAIVNGDTVIIPSAEVLAIAGFGVGMGTGSGGAPGKESGEGTGGGGGGGGRVLSRPVAVIVASPEGVRVEPVVDVTKIALAFITAIGFMFALLGRMRNPRKALRELKD